MSRNRMEAFSDGVLAIIITIMVLKLELPKSYEFEDIISTLHTLVAYVLSYIYIGIYWTNHHHLISTLRKVSGRVLWENLHWLFWMSLIPFSTEWVGLNPLEKLPSFFYGIILFMSAIAYHYLQKSIIKINGKDSALAKSIGKDLKGKLSILAYGVGMIISLIYPIVAYIIYIINAILWVVPDIRVETILAEKNQDTSQKS